MTEFVSVSELRQSDDVWRSLVPGKELVVTSNGEPIAILSATTEATMEDLLAALRQSASTARGGRHAAARPHDRSRSANPQGRELSRSGLPGGLGTESAGS